MQDNISVCYQDSGFERAVLATTQENVIIEAGTSKINNMQLDMMKTLRDALCDRVVNRQKVHAIALCVPAVRVQGCWVSEVLQVHVSVAALVCHLAYVQGEVCHIDKCVG
jgi:hypothetical protein